MNISKFYKNKRYTHFDSKKGIKLVRHLVENTNWVSHHGFYPFIHYEIKMVKYNGIKRKDKGRHIYYSAHIDRYIYALYANKINSLYNQRANKDCINQCAIAYRNCLHKNNIHFAKEVFDFIKKVKDCFVIIGDFTNFFDSLDHIYLKGRLKDLLSVTRLPDDFYAVYKNITKFAYIDYQDLLNVTGMTRKNFGRLKRALNVVEFHHVKKQYLRRNQKSYGIPQGAAISSVLSNVYMLEFDKKINDYTSSLHCLYRRYSDDFMLVIPKQSGISLNEFWTRINNIIQCIPQLDLQPDKTKVFELTGSEVKNINNILFPGQMCGNNNISYLGFTFDGSKVYIRDKTIHKYYSRLYHKIATINKYSELYKRNVFRKTLYERYTHLGNKNPWNCKCGFLSYVNRAAKILGDESIKLKTKSHIKKIGQRLRIYS